jgi:hypothetical protein
MATSDNAAVQSARRLQSGDVTCQIARANGGILPLANPKELCSPSHDEHFDAASVRHGDWNI